MPWKAKGRKVALEDRPMGHARKEDSSELRLVPREGSWQVANPGQNELKRERITLKPKHEQAIRMYAIGSLDSTAAQALAGVKHNPTLEDAIMPNKINVGSGITRLTSFITDAKAAQSATDNTWDNLESLSTGQRRTETNVNSLQEAILLSGNILNSEERESIYYELINNNVAKIAVIEPVVVSEGRTGRQVLSYRQKVDENNEPVFVDVRANPEEAINQQARNFSLNLALPMDEFDITTSNKFMGDIPAIVEYKLRRDEILANSFWTENNVAITPNNAHNFSSTIRLPVGHANIGTSGDIESIESLFNENGHGTSFQKARTFHTGQFIEEQLKLFQEGKQHDLIFQRDANNNIVRDRNNTPIIQGLTSQGQSKRDESFRNFVAEGKMTDFLEGPGQNVREGTAAGRFIRSVFGDGRNRQSSFVPIQSTVGVNMIPGEVRQSLNRYYNYSLPYDHPVRFGNSDVNFVRDITGNKPMPTVFADRVFSRTKFYNRDGTSYYAMAVEATTWVTRDQARRIGLPHITGGNNETEVMDRSNLRDLGINRERTTQRNIENIRKPGMTDAEALELQQRIRSGSQGDAVFEITVFVPIFNAEMLDRYTPQGNQNAKERVSLQSWITPNANELEAAGRSTGTLRQ